MMKELKLKDFPELVLVFGFGLGSIGIVGDRVFVTYVVATDALRERTKTPSHLSISWTEEAEGWERDAVLRRIRQGQS